LFHNNQLIAFFQFEKKKITSSIIAKATEAMKDNCKDQQGKSELYFMAYELLNIENKNPNRKCIYDSNEMFWKYRPTITFQSLKKEIYNQTSTKDYLILKKFIENKESLELLQYLPHIVRLQNIFDKYLSKKIFKDYATHTTIGDFLSSKFIQRSDSNMRADIESLVRKVQEVWLACKLSLMQYVYKTMVNTYFNDAFYEAEFNMNTKLSSFLPTQHGDGQQMFVLISFLVDIQNEFLQQYSIIYRSKLNLTDDRTFVVIKELSFNEFENLDYIIKFNDRGEYLTKFCLLSRSR
jgi:hypothetical protein